VHADATIKTNNLQRRYNMGGEVIGATVAPNR
jgi:hypothetical protein